VIFDLVRTRYIVRMDSELRGIPRRLLDRQMVQRFSNANITYASKKGSTSGKRATA
jgi:hypothetical protein